MYLSKDFIETAEGLVFAVVDQRLEQGRVLCFLRYIKDGSGWSKCSTITANALLKETYPQYYFYSSVKDVQLHAVPLEKIVMHHQPKKRLQTLLSNKPQDKVEKDLLELCRLFEQSGLNLQQVGVTGSMLIGAQKEESDIDLVLYGRENFSQCRELIRQLSNSNHLQNLNDNDWLLSYERRLCELNIEDYIWHERRKFNKATINGRKFDIGLLEKNPTQAEWKFTKCGKTVIKGRVVDDTYAFDYPAIYKLEHPQATECVSFTATYTGQAFTGENVEISGTMERGGDGKTRIVVGSSREAEGEYIKVISNPHAA